MKLIKNDFVNLVNSSPDWTRIYIPIKSKEYDYEFISIEKKSFLESLMSSPIELIYFDHDNDLDHFWIHTQRVGIDS